MPDLRIENIGDERQKRLRVAAANAGKTIRDYIIHLIDKATARKQPGR